MKCPKCYFNNPEGSKFCGNCGVKYNNTCPQCNYSNPVQFKFCGECGHNILTPTEPLPTELSFDEKLTEIQKYLPEGITEKIFSNLDKIEGERKQVTIMFCDMAGFTSLSEKIGPEKAYDIMGQVYEILIHKVHNYEGTVNEMTGDGIMAIFGAPIALEDAQERALRASLAIHRKMARFSQRLTQGKENLPPLKMRIGIHTGLVVVGAVGNDLRVEFKAVGDTVNLASRMEGLAEPGTTYTTEATFKVTENLFRFEALGKREVKGKKAAVNVYRVIASRTRRTRFDVNTERGLTPLAGRERELELLLDCFERSKVGRGQAISIISDAGLGKSRLLYEFRKAVASEELTFLEGRCLSYSSNVAYHPIIDILKSNFDIHEKDDDSDVRKKIKDSLKLYGTEEPSIMPFILELLSVKESGIDKISLSSEAIKNRIFEALIRIVLTGAEIRPLILAIEDLHWVDKTSEEFINNLLDSISGTRVLLIFTFRPESAHTWDRRSYHNQVNLNRLSDRESLLMASHLLGADELDIDLTDLILEKTEGVPFFIEEFIRSLKDMEIIECKANRCRLTKDIQHLAIPSTIQDVIMARVDSLPVGAKEVLLTGSVIGREFDYNLIKSVTGLPENELLHHLSVLRDSEHIYEREIYPQVTYIFKHALIQDVTYQSLLKSTCQKHHRKIAHVMEQHFPEIAQVQPEVMGHHFTEAGLTEQAIPYWQKAGEIAIRRSANLEAIGHFHMALEMLKTLSDYPQRTRQELDLLIRLGPTLMATKGYAAEEVEMTFARAWELCQNLGETSQLFNVLRGLWGYFVVRGELQTAYEQGQQCFALARQAENPALLLWARFMLGLTLFHLGEPASARDHLEQGMVLYDPQKRRTHRALQDPGVACQSYRAVALWLLGYPDQALKKSREALDLAYKLDHPFSLMYALYMAAVISQLVLKAKETQQRAEAANALCAECGGQPFWSAWGLLLRGWALSEQGEIEAGLAEERQGLVIYSSTGSMLAQPYLLALQAETYGKGGQIEEGITVLTETLSMLDKTGERWWEAELHRLKGELLLVASSNNYPQAEACFNEAFEIARRQSAKSLEMRAAMSLGRLWQQRGKKEKARQMVAEVYAWFTEGFDTPDLKKAAKLLDELA
jgi:class 3 adenylate cyclase/predicted ATPase